eukprot:1160798-Pelagomonas_calceolata.AAC.1
MPMGASIASTQASKCLWPRSPRPFGRLTIGLLAIGAPALPDEFLAHTYLHKLSDDMCRKVYQAIAG